MKNYEFCQRNIDDLIPYANNSRTHSKKQVSQIASSIQEYGFTNPVLISDDNNIIAGHGRVLAAQKLKMTQVPCVVLSGLTPMQIKAYVIADNRIAENAGWDEEMLSLELSILKENEYNLELLGFEIDELEKLLKDEMVVGLTDEDEAPPVPENPISKLGDIWLLGNHRLMCGDSTDIAQVDLLMNGQKADLLFTDPPYGVSYADKNKSLNAVGEGNRIERKIINDHMTVDETGELFLKSFKSGHHATKEGASYYICGPQGGDLMMMMMMIEQSGWQRKHMIVWVKNNHVLGRMDYHYKHEPIFYGWKQKNSHKFYGNKSQTSVWNFDKPLKSDLHPTMKPVELVAKAIENSSKSGDIVLDLFGGSGSTLIACEKTKRTAYLMELDPHYVDVIIKRWQDYTGQKATHAVTGIYHG